MKSLLRISHEHFSTPQCTTNPLSPLTFTNDVNNNNRNNSNNRNIFASFH